MTESEISTELLAAVKAGPLPLARWAANNTTRIRYVVRRGVSALSYEKAERALNSVILELDNAVADTDRYARAGRFRDAWHAWRRTDDPLIALDSKFINWPGRAEAIERARNVFQAHKRILEPQFPPSAWEHKEQSEAKAEAQAEEAILQEIADEAMREARKVTIESGNLGRSGQFEASTIVSAARAAIRERVDASRAANSSPSRRNDLLLAERRLVHSFEKLIEQCEQGLASSTKLEPLTGHGSIMDRFDVARHLYQAILGRAKELKMPGPTSDGVDVAGLLKIGPRYFHPQDMAALERGINAMLSDLNEFEELSRSEVAKHKEPEKPVQKAAETEWWTSHGYNKTGMYDMFIHQDYDYIKREPVFEVGRDSGGYWNVLAKASNMEDAQRIAEKILYDEFQAKLKRLKQDIAACKRRDQMQAVARLSAEAEAVEAKMKSVAPQKAKRRAR